MRNLLLVFCLIVFTGLSSFSFAEDWFQTDVEIAERWNMSIGAFAVLPVHDKNFDTGMNMQFAFSYDMYQWLALGLETGYTNIDAKINALGYDGIGVGTLHQMPLIFDIILKYPVQTEKFLVVPYLTNGFGFIFTRMDESNNVDPGCQIDPSYPFVYKLGFGLDFFTNDMLALMLECSYQWYTFKYSASIGGIDTGTINIDGSSLYLGGGVRLKF